MSDKINTEKEILYLALERIQKAGIISNLNDDGKEISYFAPDRLGYYPTFRYNDKGELIHAGVTI